MPEDDGGEDGGEDGGDGGEDGGGAREGDAGLGRMADEDDAGRSTAGTESAMRARTGRENQRYNEQKQRLVAGCICYRRRSTPAMEDSARAWGSKGGRFLEGDVRDEVEVLMLNSKKGARVRGRDLIFPKGGWELDETDFEAAARECFEEGGVTGDVSESNETYEFYSRSRVRAGAEGDEARCVAHVFTMRVLEEHERWPEDGVRTRYWLDPLDAWRRCKHDWMRQALVDCEHLRLGDKATFSS